MSINNERSYYSEGDIALPEPGYLRLGQVVSYNGGTKRGVCIIDYLEYAFMNPHSPSPSVNDLIVVAQVEHEKLRVMLSDWTGV